MALSPTAYLLASAGMTDESDAVLQIIERGTLLKLLGRPLESGQPLRSEMHEVLLRSPSIAQLHARVMATVPQELAPTLATA